MTVDVPMVTKHSHVRDRGKAVVGTGSTPFT